MTTKSTLENPFAPMKCERCNKKVHRRIFYPGLATITKKLRHGEWLCVDCVNKLEGYNIDFKRRWIRNINAKQEKPRITEGEYKYHLEESNRFRCPKNYTPEDCDGHNCPSDKQYHRCLAYLQRNTILYRVNIGEIIVTRSTQKSWEIPV